MRVFVNYILHIWQFSAVFKKEMACIFCRTRIFRCTRLVGIGEKPLRLHRRGARCLKCGIKPNKSYRNEAGGSLATLNFEMLCKTTVWGPRSISIVQQQERKEDRLEDGEKIQFEFALIVAKKSTNFSSGGKGKGGGICRQLLGRFLFLCVTHSVLTSTT